MSNVILVVRKIQKDAVTLTSAFSGTFKMQFSKRSPALKGMKFKVGDKIKVILSKAK